MVSTFISKHNDITGLLDRHIDDLDWKYIHHSSDIRNKWLCLNPFLPRILQALFVYFFGLTWSSLPTMLNIQERCPLNHKHQCLDANFLTASSVLGS